MKLISDGETIRCGTDSIYSRHPWEGACRPVADTLQHKQFACQLQWAHGRGHGTETALRRIHNDLLAMTGGGNDARLPYTLSPYHLSSLYTVSLSVLFLTTPCFVPGLFFRLFAAFCCLFLVCFSVCLLLSVVCSWFVFPPVCCFLLFVPGLFFRPSSPASSPGSSIRRLFRNDNKLKRDTSDTQYILLNWLQSLNTMDGPFQQH